jgi:hypothetical protein
LPPEFLRSLITKEGPPQQPEIFHKIRGKKRKSHKILSYGRAKKDQIPEEAEYLTFENAKRFGGNALSLPPSSIYIIQYLVRKC